MARSTFRRDVSRVPTGTGAGFTLLEVLLAVLFLAAGYLTIIGIQSQAASAIRSAERYNLIRLLAQRKLAEIELQLDNTDFASYEPDNGDFGEEHEGYRWELKTQEFNYPIPPQLTANADDGQQEMIAKVFKVIIEFINKSVKEIALTIYVDMGVDPKTDETVEWEFTITTLRSDPEAKFDPMQLASLFSGAGGGGE